MHGYPSVEGENPLFPIIFRKKRLICQSSTFVFGSRSSLKEQERKQRRLRCLNYFLVRVAHCLLVLSVPPGLRTFEGISRYK